MWAYSRHPNYFGESLAWFGIYSFATGVEEGWKTIFSPIALLLLLRLWATNFMEAAYKDDQEHKDWRKVTNVFLPWLPHNYESIMNVRYYENGNVLVHVLETAGKDDSKSNENVEPDYGTFNQLLPV